MRQQLPVALAALAVLLLGWLGYQQWFGAKAEVTLSLVDVTGPVTRVRADGGQETPVIGTTLQAEDQLRTGQGGHATLAIGAESRLNLQENSSIRVLGVDATGVRVELEEGRVSARVRPGSPSLGVESRGRALSVADGAILASVQPDGTLAMDVTEGSATLTGIAGADLLAQGRRLVDVPGTAPVQTEIPSELLLHVSWPEQQAVTVDAVTLQGTTDPLARVRVGGAETRAGPDGRFQVQVPLQEGVNALTVEAQDVQGTTQTAEGTVQRDSTAPKATRAEVQWRR